MPERDWQNDPLLRPRERPSLRAHFDAMRPTAKNAEGRQILCPECRKPIWEREQPEHLMAVHGYMPVSGILLSWPATLACLWDRVFNTGDTQAHEQLCQLLNRRAGKGKDTEGYAAALEAELRRRMDTLFSRRQELERAAQNLRQCDLARAHFWQLLMAKEPRIQEVGRELLLPEIGQTLANAQTAAEVRQDVDKLCPNGDVWDKVRVCRRLPNYGAAKAPAAECLRQLQAERPVACPECRAAVPQDQLENHLRQVHRVYQFRGTQLSLEETTAALFTAVCSPQADYEAWEALLSLLHEQQGAHADSVLAMRLSQQLELLPRESRVETVRALAEHIAAGNGGQAIIVALAKTQHRLARQLALRAVARLKPPIDESVVQAVRPLLTRRGAARPLQIEAAAALLRTSGPQGMAAASVIEALIARCGKAQALHRLRQLQQETGLVPAIADRCLRIQSRIRMRCPRCRIQLRHPEMTMHLWTEHSLLLDGLRAREPWHLVRDWIRDYQRNKNAELLVRCRMLGQRLDPEEGLHRVYRMLLAQGIDDVEARQVLLAKAKQRQASLCPHCYALVPVPDEIILRPLNESRGRLSHGSYCVEVREKGLRPWLTMETPDAVVFRGPEPGRWLTRKWSTLFLAGPPVIAALVYAVLAGYWEAPPHWPVELAVLVALVLYLVVRLHWWKRPRLVDRAVDHGWTSFVPDLCARDLPQEGSSFLAGLALTSLHHGRPHVRVESLRRTLHFVENTVPSGILPLAHLAALKRLARADAAAMDFDPIPDLATDIGRCFAGELPLTFAQQLLEDWTGSWWNSGNLARLRILLCDQAFEAGLEVLDLIDAGHSAPALGAVLHVEDPDGLARLRLLWSLRPTRPWDRWSDAATVFELANDPESSSKLLAKHADLLLADRASTTIHVCGRGIIFKEILFAESPRRVEVKARRDFDRVEHEVVIDEHRFRYVSDPSALAHRLDRWFRYYFQEFLPQVGGVYSWPAPVGRKPLRFREAVSCPSCGRSVVTVTGEVGRPAREESNRE